MNNKYGYFKYSDIAFGAKEGVLGYGYTGELQNGSSVSDLHKEVRFIDFASFEQGEYITSKPKLLYKGKEKLGFVTKTISDENGFFSNPISFDVQFNSYYSMTGITLKSRNVIKEIEIFAYRDGEEIASGSFVAENKEQFYPLEIETANQILIVIRKIAEPFHFLGIYNIEYGTIRLFDESRYQNATVTQHFSVLGDTLEYDTLDLSIVDFENKDYLFQAKQPIEYIADNNVKAKFYINEGKEKNEIMTDLSCYDAIASLEDDFFGGIYENYPAKQLIDDIFSGKQINYEVDESINDIKLNGYLPISSRRKALQAILQGSNIRCYKGKKFVFKPLETQINDVVLNKTNIIGKPEINKKQEIKSVIVQSHDYSKSPESVEIHHWYLSTTKEVVFTFSEPLHSVVAYDVTGTDENGNDIVSNIPSERVSFVKKEANYCVVRNYSRAKVVIKGLKYADSSTFFQKVNPYLSANGLYNEININLTISSNPQEVCDLLYDLYSRKNSINFITFENLKIGGYYNILGENLNIKSIKQSLNGLYEVEAV